MSAHPIGQIFVKIDMR